MRTQVGDRRRRTRRADARPAARVARDRVRDPRGARPRVRAAARARRRARAGDDGPDGRGRARRADARARASCTTGVELRFDGEGHRIALTRADRRPRDHDLRPAGGRQGPDRRAPGVRAAAALRGLRRDGRPGRRRGALHARGRAARAGVRRDRGLRRLPRRLPAGDRRRADGLRARVPVRLDGDPGRVRAAARRS